MTLSRSLLVTVCNTSKQRLSELLVARAPQIHPNLARTRNTLQSAPYPLTPQELIVLITRIFLLSKSTTINACVVISSYTHTQQKRRPPTNPNPNRHAHPTHGMPPHTTQPTSRLYTALQLLPAFVKASFVGAS